MTNYTTRDLTRQVASIIRGLMARYDVTQQQMADAVGVSQSQLSKMIRGMRAIDIDQLWAMCWALGVEASDVIAQAESAIADYDHSVPARMVFVEEGLRLSTPYDLSAAWETVTPVTEVASTRSRGGNVVKGDFGVGGRTHTDLETVELDSTKLAASTDDTPIDPSRGEAD